MSTRTTPAPRRRSAPATRAAIAEVARELFSDNGFDAVGIRAIATGASVDPALVIRYFGSKEELFVEVMTVDLPTVAVMEGPLESLGTRLVGHLLGLADGSTTGSLAVTALSARLRASDRERVRETLHAAIEQAFAEPLRSRLTGPDVELRAHLVAAQVGGLLTSLHVVRDDVLRGADRERLARHYGAAIQRLVDG